MDMLDALLGGRGNDAAEQLGRQFGLDPSQASAALSALLPALAAGFQKNAATPTGLESLLGALTRGKHQQYVDDMPSLGLPGTADDGNGILGHIFGSKDVSREVANQAAAQTGLGADVLKKMLPVVAALVMGSLARQQFGGAASQPGWTPQAGTPAPGGGGGLLDMLGPLLSGGNASIADSVIGMLGKAIGGR